MRRIRVRVAVDASPRRVWSDVRDIASHVDWMADATAIRFASHQRTGVGTAFECDTRLGPIRLTDRMEVTEWDEGATMGIRHVGLVKGVGRFTVRRRLRGGTWFTWEERLRFPLWMGGPVGSLVAVPALRWVWKRNLRNLKSRIEGASSSRSPRRGRRRGRPA